MINGINLLKIGFEWKFTKKIQKLKKLELKSHFMQIPI